MSGCEPGGGEEAAPDAPKPVIVELSTLRPEELVDVVALTGQLEAEYSIQVKPEVDGVVADFPVAEGQPVAKGDVLVELRDREQRARLAEARAAMRLAQDRFDRTTKLRSRDAASEARRAEAAAELDQARARVELAQLQLDRTRVKAAFDGVVGRRLVSPGARVEDVTPLIELDAVDRLQLLFTVEESGVALARTGVPIRARVSAWPGESFPGEVFFVAPSLEPATRRLLLKAWIDNEDGRLKPGMFANVDVEIARKAQALLVPESALVYDRNGTYLWRVDAEHKAQKVPVDVGLRQDGRVEILRGVGAGDRIVAAGTHKVMSGSLVQEPGAGAHAREPVTDDGAGDET